MDDLDGKLPQSAADAPRSLRRAGCWLIAGMLSGALLTLAVLRFQLADPTPSLSEETYRAARQKWQKHGPQDYDVEVKVEGRQGATYRVQVRGGRSIAAYRNGRPLTQPRTFGTWSVPGMFGTIRRDLDQIAKRRRGEADRYTPDLTLRASFDSEYGYPQHYLRMESGSTQDVSWEVIRFDVQAE